MQMRPLGSTGIEVSILGLGTVKLGRDRGLKYPRSFQIPDDDAALNLLQTASACGMNLLDTAPAYGHSEARLGRLLPRTSVGRDGWVIVTKAGETFEPDARNGAGASTFDFSPDALRASVDRSLRRLGVSSLACVLIHSDGNDLPLIESLGSLQALDAMKQEGKIRATGISTKTRAGGVAAAECCDVVMLTDNPSFDADVEAIRLAGRRGAGVLLKKALESGHARGIRAAFDHVFRPELRESITSVIIGTTNPEHLRSNVRIVGEVLERTTPQ